MTAMCSTTIVLLALFMGLSLPMPSAASVFLRRSEPGTEAAGAEALRQQRTILAELEDALGSEHREATEARLGRLEDALRPTFTALPKGAEGTVGAPAARYALHRLFVQRHGWQVKGLEPGGESWAGTSPAAALGEKLPESVRDLFEERVGSRGLDLHELAVLASTLENLIHGESVSRLHVAYKLSNHSPTVAALVQDEAFQVIDTYMALYILGANVSSTPEAKLLRYVGNVSRWYPSWPETRRFLRNVQEEVVASKEGLSFDNLTAVVEEAGERFGRFQDAECRTLKNDLVKLEEVPGNGRVRLADFYGSALHAGKWQFSESVEYLRQLGALDESNPGSLRVIIPNYVNSPSNCIASSAYYGVCCIDECEDLLGHFERRIGAPTARPAEIITLVSALPSASQSANRTLPVALISRLEEVAAHHNGRIPLHGRLFAQWLHHAYPHECPYPHVSGTTRPQRAEEWSAAGREAAASKDEMQQHVEAGRSTRMQPTVEGGLCSAMWTMEEELVDELAHRVEVAKSSVQAGSTVGDATTMQRMAWRCVALLAALGSFMLSLSKMLGPTLAAGGDKKITEPAPWRVHAV